MVTTGTDFMKAFNIKTSEWLGTYIFRRLRFMKSILISQLAVFIFVALWHGIDFGYFAVFGLLSFSMVFDRFFFSYVKSTKVYNFCIVEYRVFRVSLKVLGSICRLFCMPFIPMGFQVYDHVQISIY